ncbi:hypothetical protein ABD76_05090 [Paenibacillus dendritiformis]|uniref:hypothetical protein n=1 Tax=Paenibacillus dendritiformis TaxID=130049 RepID=UPI0018CF28EF|nr:hypothetical protein [Paenibacillus dendritiformis]MBG9791898.1 hypothetical protein [Paenibacillus dendritiformis]
MTAFLSIGSEGRGNTEYRDVKDGGGPKGGREMRQNILQKRSIFRDLRRYWMKFLHKRINFPDFQWKPIVMAKIPAVLQEPR